MVTRFKRIAKTVILSFMCLIFNKFTLMRMDSLGKVRRFSVKYKINTKINYVDILNTVRISTWFFAIPE